MDKLDAAEHWLRGYLAGNDGMAPEDHLLKAAAEAGHTVAALRHVRDRLGAVSDTLSPAAEWSKWWWLPEASYSAADAKQVGITRTNWPYGPAIDLRARTAMVAWAKEKGLRLATPSAPLCLAWLENGKCRGCGKYDHDMFRLDHASGWTKDGAPAVIVNHPYDLDENDLRLLSDAADRPGLHVKSPGAGWYGHSTIQVEVWNSTVYEEWRKRR
ncbi:hypothetical protein ACFYY8_31485 [Streptosporangium sp. NPDC001559]|uniref:hypothetical protein n=1 Tax=Streptosporangium sp. NPDC001559 TaxID=3366187 RepID=UPI0036E46B3D